MKFSGKRRVTYQQEAIILTVDIGLPGVRIAPFLRRLLVAFPLVAVLLVFLSRSRIDAPSFNEFASLRFERLVQHFHGFLRVWLAEQATWYARGHRVGQHCEVNFATNRSCQHLEDFLCFDKFQQPTREGTALCFSLDFLLFSVRASAFEADVTGNFGAKLVDVPFSSFTCVRCSSTNRPSDTRTDFRRLFSQDFSKIRRCLFPHTVRENRASLVLTVRRPDSF